MSTTHKTAVIVDLDPTRKIGGPPFATLRARIWQSNPHGIFARIWTHADHAADRDRGNHQPENADIRKSAQTEEVFL
ncbi:MAG: hypothetical protein M3501_06845 [Actinomycetota bacterium]|nr:hypothetical protein [Actinomycetota bacterium]MDQ3529300.1 hypothetical protein [Actinomycetota bacterium]